MEVHLEHDWLARSIKVWFIERRPGRTLFLVPAPGEAGDVWKSVDVEEGMSAPSDLVPLVINDEMAHGLLEALQEADLPLRNSDVSQTLIEVLRNENERNAVRVDRMIDALITGNNPQVQHIYTRIEGEDHG